MHDADLVFRILLGAFMRYSPTFCCVFWVAQCFGSYADDAALAEDSAFQGEPLPLRTGTITLEPTQHRPNQSTC